VTVKDTEGFGVYAENCYEQMIFNSTFTKNRGNVALITKFNDTMTAMISINQTKIYDGKGSSLENVDCSGVCAKLGALSSYFTVVNNCDFQRNENGHLHVSIMMVALTFFPYSIILIDTSTFNASGDYGVSISVVVGNNESDDEILGDSYVDVTLNGTSVSNNSKSGLALTNVHHAKIEHCVFANNSGGGVILQNSYKHNEHLWTEILKSAFIGNSRAVTTDWEGIDNEVSNFTNHTGRNVVTVENNANKSSSF
jgi:hypothetical protein